jgi:hypothetical protein
MILIMMITIPAEIQTGPAASTMTGMKIRIAAPALEGGIQDLLVVHKEEAAALALPDVEARLEVLLPDHAAVQADNMGN